MQRKTTFLNDRRWQLVQGVIPPRAEGTVGRKPANDRDVLEGILYVILRDIQWMELPEGYPPYTTCFRRYTGWVKAGVWEAILDALFTDLRDRTGVDLWKLWASGKLYQQRDYGKPFLMPLNHLFRNWNDMIVGLLFYKNMALMMQEEKRRGVKG